MKLFTQPERRTCMVQYRVGRELKERRAFFHQFTTRAYPIEPSPLKGGHLGGQYIEPVAIVEYEDGMVDCVTPTCIRFLDTEKLMEQYVWEKEQEKDCLTCKYNEDGRNRPCRKCETYDKWEEP